MKRVVCGLLACVGTAAASELEVWTGYQNKALFGAVWDNISLSDGLNAQLGISNESLKLGIAKVWDFSVLGNVQLNVNMARAWHDERYLLSGKATGTLGGVALEVWSSFIQGDVNSFDALGALTLNPTRWHTGAKLRYRIDRMWSAQLEGDLRATSFVGVAANYRDKSTEWRFGAKVFSGSVYPVAITGGGTWALPEDTGHISLDGTLFLDGHWGATAKLSVFELPEIGNSTVSLFAAYEPFYADVLPLKLGAESQTLLGNNTLGLAVYSAPLNNAWGGKVSYRINLNPPESEDMEIPEE